MLLSIDRGSCLRLPIRLHKPAPGHAGDPPSQVQLDFGGPSFPHICPGACERESDLVCGYLKTLLAAQRLSPILCLRNAPPCEKELSVHPRIWNVHTFTPPLLTARERLQDLPFPVNFQPWKQNSARPRSTDGPKFSRWHGDKAAMTTRLTGSKGRDPGTHSSSLDSQHDSPVCYVYCSRLFARLGQRSLLLFPMCPHAEPGMWQELNEYLWVSACWGDIL